MSRSSGDNQVWKIMKSQTCPDLKSMLWNCGLFFFLFLSLPFWFFDPRATLPVIPLSATANCKCFMSPILQFHYADATCHVGLLSYPHIKHPQFTVATAALFETVSRSSVIQFFLGFSQHTAPVWYWAFVSGNNIKTILWQLKLSLCLPHF